MNLKTEIEVFKAINKFNGNIYDSKCKSSLFKCVPIEYYIYDLGWMLIPYSSKDKYLMEISNDGFSTFLDKRIQIFFNQDVQLSRKRFTIAHEVGHIICGHHNTLQKLGRLSNHFNDSLAEQQANIVARNVLVPVRYYNDLIKMTSEEVSKEFCVSKTMAGYRLSALERDMHMTKLATKAMRGELMVEKR